MNIQLPNKENAAQNTTNQKKATKSMNFGKQVRQKAHLNDYHSPILKQMRFSENIEPQWPTDTPKTSKPSFQRLPSFDPDDSRVKIVRFEDQERFGANSQFSQQSSKMKKKNQSILKKTPSSDNISINSGTSDMGQIDSLNPKSSLKDQGTNCSNENYQKQLKRLKGENTKFTDRLFPPGSASLCYSKEKRSTMQEVRWVRIEQLFKGRKLVLFKSQMSEKCILNTGPLRHCHNLVTACNALSNNNRCLVRIFEEQKVTGLCIYSLRINHEGIWKYVVVDDYIPVVREGHTDVPAFTRVIENEKKEIEIWPLLIAKALAKIYNSYQALFEDGAQNFLYDLTGFPSETINLQDQQSQFHFRNSLTHSSTVSLVSNPFNMEYFREKDYALREDGTNSSFFTLDLKLKLIDMERYNNLLIDVGDLKREFRTASLFSINETYYSLGCVVKQHKNNFSLRKFVVRERGMNCIMSLIQKDRKHYHNNGYCYVWARMMVVAKEGDLGYRWIAGKYEQAKLISVKMALDPGEYYVIVNGDWKEKIFEMTLNYQGNQEIRFEREPIESHPYILSETCTDLAQRFGKLKQLNRRLCAYRLMDRTNGFIIENINNEVGRNVVFYKQYRLEGCNYEILNKDCLCQDSEEDQDNLVEIKIKPNSHFTFIAKFKHGVDGALLRDFRFD